MKRLSVVFFGYTLLATTAYAATFSEREIMDRLNSIEQRVNTMHSSGQGGAGGGDAAIQVQLDELREQLRAMNGKIEETQYKIKNVEAQLLAQQKDAEFRFKALETASAPAAAAVPTTAPATAAPQPTMGGEANVAPAAEATPPAANSAFATSKEHYNYALALMNKAQYKEAGDSFADFVKQYPKDPLAGNVFYWLGETWYVRGDYVKAADSFRQGFEAMPQGNKAPDNLLKLAMSLGQMKQQKQSCVVLAQLLKKFSGPEIVRARATREQEKQACAK